MAIYYIDCANGNDSLDGLTPKTAKKSYRSLTVLPGDSLLFKRGTVHHEQLLTVAGDENAPVTYGAYGEGERPIFCSSTDLSCENDWKEISPHIWACQKEIPGEVGNFAFGPTDCSATLRWAREDLCAQGDFWDSHYLGDDRRNPDALPAVRQILMYSLENPALHYPMVDCISYGNRVLAAPQDYTIFEDLCFRNSGVHGIAGAADHVIIRRCHFENIGGCVWSIPLRIRFGNAVEFYGHGSHITVRECTFLNIYDSCVTHQGPGEHTVPTSHFICCDNVFDTYGMAAFEYRDKLPIDSLFSGNVCRRAGCGFAMLGEELPRRSEIWPQPMGHHIFLWRIPTPTDGGSLRIENNEFGSAPAGAAIYSIISPEAEAQMIIDRNVYTEPSQLYVRFAGKDFHSLADFRHETGCEQHSPN